MVVHPAPGSPSGTLVNALLHHCGETLSGVGGEKRPGIVHRIDKDTSGLLVVAKTDAGPSRAGGAVSRSTVTETLLLALVYGVPDANDPRVRGVRGVSFEPGRGHADHDAAGPPQDRPAETGGAVPGRAARGDAGADLERFGAPEVASLVECRLETGRTHQIRVHMAHAGHGLVGDPDLWRAAQAVGAQGALWAGGRQEAPAIRRFRGRPCTRPSWAFERHPVSGETDAVRGAPARQDMADLLAALSRRGRNKHDMRVSAPHTIMPIATEIP